LECGDGYEYHFCTVNQEKGTTVNSWYRWFLGQDFIKTLNEYGRLPLEMDVKKLMNLCTCEILGRIGCGVKPDIFKDPDNNVFYQQMLKLIGQSGGKLQMLKVMLVMFMPSWIGYYSKISFIPQETSDFFC